MIKRYSIATDEIVPVTQEYFDSLERKLSALAALCFLRPEERADHNEDLAREAARLALAGDEFLARIDTDLCGLNAQYAPLNTPILVYSNYDRCWIAAEAKKGYQGRICFWPIPSARDADEIYEVVSYLPMLPKPANAKK